MASRKSTGKSCSIYCQDCNVFIQTALYNEHIQGKQHKKNTWKMKKLNRNNETQSTKSFFVFEEPASLDIQFQSFLNQVLLTQEECSTTSSRILQDLEPCLTTEFGKCHPYVFGSMATGLALVGSDVDIYLDTGIYKHLVGLPDPKPELQKIVVRCARVLRSDAKFSHIVPISQARVPIVKFMHNPTGVSCDISFKDSLGVHNSQLLRFYMHLNPRFFEVMVAIKFWAKQHGLCQTDGISSYGWTLLFISFLQSLKLADGNSLVPSVNDLQKAFRPVPWSMIYGWRVDFHPKQNFVALPDDTQFSHFGLLKGFFHYYKNFCFEENIVCPYLGQPIPWAVLDTSKSDALPPDVQWYESQLTTALSDKVESRHPISIQDPFQQDFLVGRSCSRKKFERVVALLKASARICQSEEEISDPNTSTFLTDLLALKLEDFQEQLSVKIKGIPGVRREVVFEEAFQMLEEIFAKIMKFAITKESLNSRPVGEPDTKVPKNTDTQDVHQRNDCVPYLANYKVEALDPVWRFRKKCRKEVKLSFPETAFEFETKLSNVVVCHNYPSERIEFQCNVGVKKQSLEIILKQVEGQSSNNVIKELFQFLKCTLPAWMNTFLLEKFSNPQFLLAARSDSCSSASSAAQHDVEVEESDTTEVQAEEQSQTESQTLTQESNGQEALDES